MRLTCMEYKEKVIEPGKQGILRMVLEKLEYR